MADKTVSTKIQLRYDTFDNWKDDSTAGKGANYVPLRGEVCIAQIDTETTGSTLKPVMFKVGDGTNTFAKLDWMSAKAADVYSWAKLSEDAFKEKYLKKSSATEDTASSLSIIGQDSDGQYHYDSKIKAMGDTLTLGSTGGGTLQAAYIKTHGGGLMQVPTVTTARTLATTDDIVQSDWDVADTASKAYIKNKPTLGDAASKGVDTTTISPAATDDKLPTSKAVSAYVAEQIKGGTSIAYVIDETDTSQGNANFDIPTTSDISTLSLPNTTIKTIDNKLPTASSFKVGDIIYTKGAKVKDWFYAGLVDSKYTFYQISGDTPDLSGYVTTSAAQTITGTKTFKNVSTYWDNSSGAHTVSITSSNGEVAATSGEFTDINAKTANVGTVGTENKPFSRIYANTLYANSSAGSAQYGYNSITYTPASGENLTYDFPSSSGTLALTGDLPVQVVVHTPDKGQSDLDWGGKTVHLYGADSSGIAESSDYIKLQKGGTSDPYIFIGLGDRAVTTDDTLILSGGTSTTVI